MDTLRLLPLERMQADASPGAAAWRAADRSDAARNTFAGTMKLEAAATVRPAPEPRASVRELMILRGIAAAGQVGAVAAATGLGVSLPLRPIGAVIVALVALNVVTFVRLRQLHPVNRSEVVAFLLFDLASFTALLYLSGGSDNPFSLLYVLHAVLMALLLVPTAAALGTVVIVACYIALAYVHQPLELASGDALPAPLRMLGLQISLALTAAFSAWFVARIVVALRKHERLVADAVQRALRDDAVLRVGTVAAGAAHELATPLSRMAVLAQQMSADADTSRARVDAERLRAQIEICRRTIADLMGAAGFAEPASGGAERLDQFLEGIAHTCRITRPEARILSDWSAVSPAAAIFGDHALRQALLSLLNNAVDASPDDVRFVGWRTADTLRIAIVDRGQGLRPGDAERLGHSVFSTKPQGKGAGLGVVLAARTLERLGGTLRFEKDREGGTRVEIALPLATLAIGEL